MKSLNKALSIFLCLVFILNMVPIVRGTGAATTSDASSPFSPTA